MMKRVNNFIETLEKSEMLVFERIVKFLIDCKDFVPFNSNKPLDSSLFSIQDLAVIIQFLTYNENFTIGPSNFIPLTENEKNILKSHTYVKKSAESPFYSSYIVEQDFINELIPNEHFWIYEPYRSVNVDQRIVDMLVVGRKKSIIEETWQNLIQEYENKRDKMRQKVESLRQIFADLFNQGLALGGILRGSVDSDKRFPTENDVDIAFLTSSENVNSVIKSFMIGKVDGFKRINWMEEESIIIDLDEEYELDIDLVSVACLPLHPIMAKAHIDIIDDSTILFGEEAVKQYREKLKEIMIHGVH